MMYAAKRAVENQLLDGSSADYREVKAYKTDEGTVICGEVNGKNAFGAMAGYKHFFYRGGGVAIIQQAGSGPDMGGLWSAEGCDGSKGSPVKEW